MSAQSQPYRHFRLAGLILFLSGFALFVATVGFGNYRIDSETLQSLSDSGSIKDYHRDALYGALGEIQDQTFSSVLKFVAEVDQRITQANDQLGGGGKIWDYDRGQYKIAISRAAAKGWVVEHTTTVFVLALLGAGLGALVYFLVPALREPPGVKNNGIQTNSARARGAVGIAIGAFLISFYILLYFFPEYITNWIRLADPVSHALRNQPANQWFFYGTLYTLTIGVMGVRMLVNYRHSRYHLVRTSSVMFFQTGFAFLIPAIMARLNKPEIDFKNAWPLDYSFFYSYRMDAATSGDTLGWVLLFWGLALAFLVVPALAAFFGKRWYCSWVCGCGGLAETLGDPFRHLSSKKLSTWRIERWLVHLVLVFAVTLSAIVVINWYTGRHGEALLGELTGDVQKWYGFAIGSIFAGVIGTGFYPLMGNRVWCRFGCPLAAILGLVQKYKSRFRITTNGGQCISCGNCSTFCEMGIDVRWYAQRGQNIIRASCVGCGVCAAVCPRGVLRLENGPIAGRYNEVSLVQLGRGRIDIS